MATHPDMPKFLPSPSRARAADVSPASRRRAPTDTHRSLENLKALTFSESLACSVRRQNAAFGFATSETMAEAPKETGLSRARVVRDIELVAPPADGVSVTEMRSSKAVVPSGVAKSPIQRVPAPAALGVAPVNSRRGP